MNPSVQGPATPVSSAPAPAPAEAATQAAAQPAPKAAPAPVVKTPSKAARKAAPRAAAQPATEATPKAASKPARTAASKPASKPAPKLASKPQPKAAAKAAATPAAKPAVPAVVAAPVGGKVKHKLVRDSFTIPKDEYSVLVGLKQRAGKLAHHARKSEILRAGVRLLSALPDAGFLTALKAVPSLKTGRPKQEPVLPLARSGKKSAR